MLRNLVAILLLIAFTVQSFNTVFLVVTYYANNAAFAKNCINKALPQLNCHGQCVLMKKIQAEQRKEQKNPELKLENKSEVYILSRNGFECLTLSSNFIIYPQLKNTGSSIDHSSMIFRPPIA
ncbi:MAG: hypothetical protein JNK79_14810 [Chitinophagaceae bacterium]|nr:hypothetical protein [Chitinophagaceae bacterium]